MAIQGFVYILSSKRNGVLYTGAAKDLMRRIEEHRERSVTGFTKKYNVHRLVYYEVHCSFKEALIRERQIKKWKRQWKISLIEKANPEWRDLADDW